MPPPVIRIFSDLHYRDGESRLQNLEALAPLLEGTDRIVLNGDTLDTHDDPSHVHLSEVRAFFAGRPGNVLYLSGNHDPEISPQAELSLADDRVWITHGDVLFDDIAPWSALRDEMVRRIAEETRDLAPDQRGLIETRLRVNRLACVNLKEPHSLTNHGLANRAVRLAQTLFPPKRLLAMLQAWRTSPARACRLAREQRPFARLIVLGHTHYPGVWHQPDGLTVVNTGSFSRPLPAQFVELCGEEVRVVGIVRRQGAFHPGKIMAAFPLAPGPARAY